MWILPKNIKQQFLSAQGQEDLNLELSELAQNSESSLMWKSKVLSAKIWFSKWNKVWWMKHLSGAILKPSMGNHFTEWWILSLEVIPVNHSVLQDNEKENSIPVTSGLTLEDFEKKASLEQLDLFAASSKTFLVTSNSDIGKSNKIWNRLVIKLKKEYSQRKRLALRTREKDYSSLLYTTPVSTDLNRNTKYQQGGSALSLQAKWSTPNTLDGMEPKTEKALRREIEETIIGRKMLSNLRDQVVWPTPVSSEVRQGFQDRSNGKKGTQESLTTVVMKQKLELTWSTPRVGGQEGYETRLARGKDMGLQGQVEFWGTPTTRDYKDGTAKSVENVPTNGLLGRMVHSTHGHQDQENLKSHGKNLVLNPAWVLQLMGTTLEKTFFAWREMQ